MALESNLGIQADRLKPPIQDYAVARARASWSPTIFTGFSQDNTSTPPESFLAGTEPTIFAALACDTYSCGLSDARSIPSVSRIPVHYPLNRFPRSGSSISLDFHLLTSTCRGVKRHTPETASKPKPTPKGKKEDPPALVLRVQVHWLNSHVT